MSVSLTENNVMAAYLFKIASQEYFPKFFLQRQYFFTKYQIILKLCWNGSSSRWFLQDIRGIRCYDDVGRLIESACAGFFIKNDFTLSFNKFLELGEVNNLLIFKGVRKWICR